MPPPLSLAMNIPKRPDSRGKRSSPTPSPLTPPDSAEELSTSPSSPLPLQSSSSSAYSLSQPAQHAFDIFRSIKQGRSLGSPWHKLRLQPGDFSLLVERLKSEEDLWGYVDDKIRFDYDPQTYFLVFRMPTGTHEVFTCQVVEEINNQLQRLRIDISGLDVTTLAKSIIHYASTDIYLPSDSDQSKRSPDSSFKHIDTQFPALVIETSFSQKKKDLPRLADDYIFGSDGNIKLMVGLDIEYRNSKRATISVWESRQGIEDGVPYLYVEKIVDDKLFQNDDSSPVLSGTLSIPLSIFAYLDEPLPDVAISIPYAILSSFLKKAELIVQKRKNGFKKQLPPGAILKKRPRTPEEQLRDEDKERFMVSEKKAKKKADEEDGTWRP